MSDWEDDQYTSCENDSQRESVDYDQLMNEILDLSLEVDDRKQKLDNLASTAPLILTDVVSNFISGYLENESSAIADVLNEFCFYNRLTLTARIKCAQTINSNYNLIKIILEQIDKNFFDRDPDFNWTLVVDLMIDILTSPKEDFEIKCKAKTIIFTFFSSKVNEVYEYKIVNYIWGRTFPTNLLLDEDDMTKLDVITDETIIHKCLEIMFNNYLSIDSKTIVFITQMLKSKNWLSDVDAEKLLSVAESAASVSENENKVANICDLFLEHQTSEIAERAKKLLMSLEGVSSTNIYTSSQNIHQVQADIENFIEKLCEQPQADWSVVKTFILSKRSEDGDEEDKLSLALKRFEMDKGLYSSKSLSLQSMLCRAWSAIQAHEHSQELNKRLLEEILEMTDTCSTGYLLRLVNVFSGFEDGIKIGIFDELTTVISYRITKIVKSQPDELQSQIAEELGEYDQTNVLTNLYGPIAILHDELWNDYKPILDQQTFTDYFRAIVTKWTSL